nr:EOG090X018J [Triops cancriformis]
MDVLNKLKSTVTNTVSQLSGVLPGNPVTREYEVSKHVASAGPGLLWKVYSGYKKSTKQEAAIFVLEKKLLDPLGRREKDIVLEVIKRGIGQLTRIRHPQILTVQHPLEESRESLAFATEPVFLSLANVLGQHENAPQPLPATIKDFKLFDVEIKYGLQQLGEGLAFLHNDVKMLHCNLCPENVILNQQGAWKIFGFEFCTAYVATDSKNGWFVKDLEIDFFDDIGVKTLNYSDSLFQWDNLQKSQFYKGLPQILPKLPHRVILFRVLPCLVKEFVNASMVPFVLPCVLLIAQEASKEEFVHHILPHLKPVMKIQEPIQILLIFMQKMELLLQKTPAEDVKADVLPMIYRAIEAESPMQIQELCLSIIPTFAALIDYPAMKNALLPRIKKLCQNTQQLSVRVNALLCIGKLLDNLDKWLVLDEILPLLPKVPSKDPAVLMAILGIYKLVLNQPKLGIPKETLATQIVPFLFPMLVEPGLNVTQFSALAATIKDMFQRVEEEQRVKLQNVQAIQQEQRSALEMTLNSVQDTPKTSATTKSLSSTSNTQETDVFSGLGLASYGKPAEQTILNSVMGPKPVQPQQPLTPISMPSVNKTQDLSKSVSYNPPLTSSFMTPPRAQRQTPQQDPKMTSLINSNLSLLTLNNNTPSPRFPGPVRQPIMQPNYNVGAFASPVMMRPMGMTSSVISPNAMTPTFQPRSLQPRPILQTSTVKPLNNADIDDLLS